MRPLAAAFFLAGFAAAASLAAEPADYSAVEKQDRRVYDAVAPAVVGITCVEGARGLKVSIIAPGSPATRAGLKVNDLILELGGAGVEELARMRRLLREAKPGEALKGRFQRGEKVQEFALTPDRNPLTGGAILGFDVSGFFGTGVTVSADGLILTSTTVVPAGAGDIRVFFMGAQQKEAKLVAVDQATESALIKVEGQGLAFVPPADSGGARAGDPAYTFGNPFGTLSEDDKVSFSAGHVSGVYKLAETGDFQSKYTDLVIETDAAVNPGSDGGPLVDAQGRLLGLMSLGFSERRWLGTAVPAHLIYPKYEALKEIKPPAEHLKPPEVLARRDAAWRAAAERVAPAVVQVIVDRQESPPPRVRGNLNYQQEAEETRRRYLMRPAGPSSGVLVDDQGRVLTACFHVTGRVNAVSVRLADGRQFPVKVLGRDEGLDLVMLQIKIGEGQGELRAGSFPHAELAEKDAVEVGSWLAVLGRSEDQGAVTVNRGLVSAIGRGRRGTIQVSALINYGNLGGPAVDLEGRVVGLAGHLSPASTWGQNSGVGFVTSAAVIRSIFADLAAGKTVKAPPRTFLGVAPGPDLPELLGAPVGRVLPNSAAAAGGLKSGDVVTHLDGAAVESWPALVRLIMAHKPGDKVKLTVRRKDQAKDLEITLGQSDE